MAERWRELQSEVLRGDWAQALEMACRRLAVAEEQIRQLIEQRNDWQQQASDALNEVYYLKRRRNLSGGRVFDETATAEVDAT